MLLKGFALTCTCNCNKILVYNESCSLCTKTLQQYCKKVDFLLVLNLD